MRLIDADALIQDLSKWLKQVDPTHPQEVNAIPPMEDIIVSTLMTIDEQPTIEERKKGEWIIRDNPGTGWYRVTCSECGEDVTSTAPCIGFFPNAKVIWDFCPWCGARMEKSDETQNT